VGGGGGGGSNGPHATSGAGGGGAGGLVAGVLNVAASSYDVAVGTGGAGGAYDPNAHNFGSDGGNSQLGDIVGLGGGGGSGGNASGRPGASGGGGRGDSPIAGGAATQPSSVSGGFGNSGGTGTGGQGAGGGGGAGSAGSNASGDNGGSGGTGRVSTITGEVRYYAGGGGGGGRTLGTPGTGGSGIGGNGANNNTDATQGAANTGSGGGGGNNSKAGADGGSGVVYVRYAGDGAVATGGDTITNLTGAYEGYTLHAFTSTGSSAFALDAGVSLSQVATFSGALSGSGGLTIAGPGTLILSGTNTYTGATTIAGGTLLITSTAALPGWNVADAYSVASGAVLAVDNAVTLGNVNTMLSTGNFADGAYIGFDTTAGERAISSAIADGSQGALGLVKLGADILRLTGSNTYTGGTIIKAGTLRIVDDGALGAVPTSFVANNIVLDGGILKNNNDSVALNANRGMTLGANHGRIEVRTDTEMVASGAISGTGKLTKADSGTLVLSGQSTYTGGTDVLAGALVIAGNNRLPTGTAFTLANTAGAAFDLGGHNQQLASLAGGGTTGGEVINTGTSTSTLTLRPTTDTAYAGLIVGNIRVEVTGSKTSPSYTTPRQRLTNADNSYTGGTLIDGGTLLATSDGALGALPTTFDPDNITLQNNGVLFNNSATLSIHANRGITLGTGGGGLSAGFSQNVTIHSQISGAAGNNLTILGNNAAIIFTANNTYEGETRLVGSESLLQIGAGGTTGSLGTGNVINGGLLSFNRSNGLTVANAISGDGNLVQAGAGTTTLTGTNTYTGTTAVNAGALLVNGTHTGAGAFTVNSGATLGGMGSISGVTTVNNGGWLAPGAGIGTLAFTNDLALKAGSTLLWEFMEAGTAGENHDTINGGKLILPASGTVNLSILGLDGHSISAGDSFVLFSGNVYQDGSEAPFDFGKNLTNRFTISDNIGWWGTWELTAGSLVLTAVPEPGTLAMLFIALALLAGRRRRS
ncbi:MAG: autotransporter-associated beta strand repeat-containing protein, partial [Patescibacteria group bacterium]|nr:autotransporter-associated beta strand repeat-containing protein [Patescibacteria group bacterium]